MPLPVLSAKPDAFAVLVILPSIPVFTITAPSVSEPNTEALAEESGVSRGTLAAIEKGSKSVSIGAYAAVLQVLEMETDLELIAVDEDGKKKYANELLISRKRARGQKGS